MPNLHVFKPGLLLNAVVLSSATFLAGALAANGSADAANSKKILSCKDAVSVVKGAGYKNIISKSCNIPYQFSATKSDCTFIISVSADGRWKGLQTGCDTVILDFSED